ncbi:MAG TPA: 4-hydroxyphenylacetate 3-hydroxylase N-terminal domain-containing protein [Stellaceae bacterium]|jgi:4-hydroxyphenylacetate 3-monooxygenase oxygenase component|nr:4-hydroxyphenylacetate 3-hydroxylase N-terminal domain-containing protein [Stellaceae bacterium]
MPARTGAEFLHGLKGAREVWVEGERVGDVTAHPAFAGAAHALAEVFDLQHRAADVCLMPDPETGEPINVSHMIPRAKADLEKRHKALQRISEYSMGLTGRTPDYMNVTYAGFAGRADEWAINGNEEGAANLTQYQKHLRRDDISLTHTIVQPTIDRSHGDVPLIGDTVALHKVEKTSHGIVVSGCRVLATLAPFADEIAVYPAVPLNDGTDAHAVSFGIAMDAPGLKFLCRDNFSRQGNKFDFPLSSRFDEQDAFVIFDRVEVPRERVFIDANMAVYNSVMARSWWPNIMQQTMIRAQTKLEFAWGLATRMAEAINSNQPQTKAMLGEIWAFAEFARAAVHSAEQGAFDYGNGVWLPDERPLAALRALLPFWFPRVNEIIRLIGAHHHFTTPSAAQFADPKLRPLLDKYLHGAGEVAAEERARLFRLAWDFTGSALGSRNEQYERFYLGSGSRNLQLAQMFQNRDRANDLVNRFLREAI